MGPERRASGGGASGLDEGQVEVKRWELPVPPTQLTTPLRDFAPRGAGVAGGDDVAGSAPVVVLSHHTWQRDFGADRRD
jgi:hypothetical protein